MVTYGVAEMIGDITHLAMAFEIDRSRLIRLKNYFKIGYENLVKHTKKEFVKGNLTNNDKQVTTFLMMNHIWHEIDKILPHIRVEDSDDRIREMARQIHMSIIALNRKSEEEIQAFFSSSFR